MVLSILFNFTAKKNDIYKTNSHVVIQKMENGYYEWLMTTYYELNVSHTKIVLKSPHEVLARLDPMLNMLNRDSNPYEYIMIRIPGFPSLGFNETTSIPSGEIYAMINQLLKNWPETSYDDNDDDSMPDLIPFQDSIPDLIPIQDSMPDLIHETHPHSPILVPQQETTGNRCYINEHYSYCDCFHLDDEPPPLVRSQFKRFKPE